MNTLVLLGFLLFSMQVQAQFFTVDIEEKQEFEINSENILFLGHATSFLWDGDNTGPAVRTVLEAAKSNDLTTVATVSPAMINDEFEAKSHYFDDSEVDYIVLSQGGYHRIRFSNLKNIFFVGGNLGRCLCEGIRDSVRDASFGKSLNLYLVIDGIYDGWPAFSPMTRETAPQFVSRFFTSSFRCPLQDWGQRPSKIISNTSLKLFYDDEYLETYDLEPRDDHSIENLKNKINVHFIWSHKIQDYMKKKSL